MEPSSRPPADRAPASLGAGSCWLRGLAFVYLAMFLGILALAYTNRLPAALGRIPYYDKIGHVVLYAAATYLGHRGLGGRCISLGQVRLPLFPLFFILFTLGEELIQQLSPHRTLDGGDMVASVAGIGLGWGLARRSRSS